MNRHYARVAERAGHRCEYCYAPEAAFNFPFEVEHILPRSTDGKHEESNMALACRSCNLFKLHYLAGLDPETNQETRLFHPRNDLWEAHFHVEVQSGAIEGLTAVGRATVARLRLNEALQISARKVWMKLGLFP
jgi:HNH endonuclease